MVSTSHTYRQAGLKELWLKVFHQTLVSRNSGASIQRCKNECYTKAKKLNRMIERWEIEIEKKQNDHDAH